MAIFSEPSPVISTTGVLICSLCQCFEHIETGHAGQIEIENDQVGFFVANFVECGAPVKRVG